MATRELQVRLNVCKLYLLLVKGMASYEEGGPDGYGPFSFSQKMEVVWIENNALLWCMLRDLVITTKYNCFQIK